MRRRLCATAAAMAAAIAVTATGCGSGGGGDTGTVTMWTYPVIANDAANQAFWKRTAAAFEARDPGITIKVSVYPWANRDAQLAAAIAADKAPDVVYMVPDQLPQYNSQQALVPVDKYLPASTLGDYRANAKAAVSSGGHLFSAPVLMSTVPLICDKRVFSKVGVRYPKTWNDLLAIAPKLKSAGYYATIYRGDSTQTLNGTFYPWLWQAGGNVFSSDGKKPAFDSSAGVDALNYLHQLAAGGYVDEQEISTAVDSSTGPIAQGKVACLTDQDPQTLEPDWGAANMEILPPLTGKKQVTGGTVGGYSLLAGSQHQTAAGKWLAYITSPAVSQSYDKAAGYFSPLNSVKDMYGNDPLLSQTEKYLNLAVPGEMNPASRKLMGVLSPEIQAALLGKESPDAALSKAASAAQPLMSQ